MSAQLPAVARELMIAASMQERMSARSERMRAQAVMAQALMHMSDQPMQGSVWRLIRKTDGARKGSPKYLLKYLLHGGSVPNVRFVSKAITKTAGSRSSQTDRRVRKPPFANFEPKFEPARKLLDQKKIFADMTFAVSSSSSFRGRPSPFLLLRQ